MPAKNSFLNKVAIRANDIKIPIEDVYGNDKQFKHFVASVLDLINKFSARFELSNEATLDFFIKKLKRDI